jgi:hypothetical protein
MANSRSETFTTIWDLGAKFAPCRTRETLGTAAKPRKCRRFPKNAEPFTRDRTGWLRMQSAANPSLPAIWEMQGDFAKMQGEPNAARLKALRSHKLGWDSPYSRSRERFVISRVRNPPFRAGITSNPTGTGEDCQDSVEHWPVMDRLISSPISSSAACGVHDKFMSLSTIIHCKRMSRSPAGC